VSLSKIRLAGLRFDIGGHLHIHILPGVGSRCPSFFLCFVGLDLNDATHYQKRNKNPGRCLRLFIGPNTCSVLMKSPLIANGAEISRIGGFVKIAKIERKFQAPR
jgi:hypothetical protein